MGTSLTFYPIFFDYLPDFLVVGAGVVAFCVVAEVAFCMDSEVAFCVVAAARFVVA